MAMQAWSMQRCSLDSPATVENMTWSTAHLQSLQRTLQKQCLEMHVFFVLGAGRQQVRTDSGLADNGQARF